MFAIDSDVCHCLWFDPSIHCDEMIGRITIISSNKLQKVKPSESVAQFIRMSIKIKLISLYFSSVGSTSFSQEEVVLTCDGFYREMCSLGAEKCGRLLRV